MNTQAAQQVSAVIQELAAVYPQWRIGQIVANVATWARGPQESATWEVTDEEFVRAAREHLQQRQNSPNWTARSA